MCLLVLCAASVMLQLFSYSNLWTLPLLAVIYLTLFSVNFV